VVVEHALEGLSAAVAGDLVTRLRRALVGRGLVILTSVLSPDMDSPPLDVVVHFERGGVARADERRREQGAELESV
jgi:hypothetical protein